MSDPLDDEQKKIIRMIEKEAIKQGLDPDFALAVAQSESNYRHIPSKDETSTAFGPFQVNKPTTSTLKYDYNDLVKNPELAVEVGVKNLVKHATDPRLEGDPTRVVYAHHYGADSPFSLTGDRRLLNPEQARYIANIGESLPNGEYPEHIYHAPESDATKTNEHTNNVYSGTPVSDYKDPEQHESQVGEAATIGAATGAGLGTVYAAKKPLIGVARHLGILSPDNQTLTPFEERVMDRGSMQRYLNSQIRDPQNPLAKVSLQRLEEVTGVKLQSPADVQRALAALQPTQGIPAERELKTVNVNGQQRKVPIYRQKSQVEPKEQTPISRIMEPLTPTERSAQAVMQTPYLGATTQMLGRVLGSAPVRAAGTLGNLMANAQDYSENKEQGNKTGQYLAGAGLAADVGSMIPRLSPLMGSIQGGLDAYKRAQNADYIGSLTSAIGASAPYVLPFALGPEVGIPAGIATALGSPLANIAKDYLQSRSKNQEQ
jgi:hypothetical protein